MIGTELEQLLRRLVREELEKILRPSDASEGSEDVERLVLARASQMRRARRGGAQ